MEQGSRSWRGIRGGRGGDGKPRPLPPPPPVVPPVPQTFIFALEVLIVAGILLAAIMIQGLGKHHLSAKFWLSAVILLLSIYCMCILFYRCCGVFARGFMIPSDAAFAVAATLVAIIAGFDYRRHILKLKLHRSPDDLTCLVLAAVSSFVFVLIAAALRQAGR